VAINRIRTLLAVCVALLIALAIPAAAPAAKGSKDKKADKQYYVSLGDSYSVGYQPPAPGEVVGSSTKDGYAYKLPKLAKKRGYDLKLVNFGCAFATPPGQGTSIGETTTTILERTTPCLLPTIGGPDYSGQTQAAAAESFIKKHRRDVKVITVSIGGNDVTACRTAANTFECVADAVQKIKTNVAALAQRLRAAAGPKPAIIGLTYPDVILGGYVSGEQSDRDLAALSVVAFRDLINPAFKEAYASGQGSFVDVTAATDAYVPFEQTTTIAPYGEIPIAVATVCRLTYYCERRDIHAKPEGYQVEAELIAAVLPEVKKNKK